MTNDMKSTFGIVDDGNTDKIIKKVQRFDKVVGQAEDSVGNLSKSLLAMDRVAEKSLNRANAAASTTASSGGAGAGGAAAGSAQIRQAGRQLAQLGGDAEVAGVKVSDMGNSVSQLATATGTTATAVAALAVATKLWQSHLDKANDEINRAVDAQEEIITVTQQGSEAAAARVQQAEREIAKQEELIAFREKQGKQEKNLLETLEASAIDVAKAVIPAALLVDELTTDAEENAGKSIKASRDIIKAEQAIVDGLENEFGPALQQTSAEAVKAAAALQQLAEQEASLTSKRQQSLDDLAFDRARRDSRAAEDAAEADASRFDQRAESARKAGEATAKIGADFAVQQVKTLKAANDAIIKTVADTIKARDKLQQEFADRAIEDQNKFNLRRIQATQDFRNAQFDAIQENDIISALRAARAFDEQEKADQNAADKEAQQREAEKQKRLQELRDEQAQRIAETRSNLAIEIAAQKKALQERLADDALAAAERSRQETKAEKATNKARAKRQRRQAEDDALADERSERAFKEQLKAIDDKRQAEQQALDAVFRTLQASGEATVRVVGEATAVVINSTGNVVQQFVTGLASAANSGGGFGGFPSFAEGGIVKRPTLALVGEKGPEAIVPLGAGGASGFGGQPIIVNITTSDIATVKQMMQAINGMAGQMARVDIQVLSDSLAGVVQ